MWFRCILAEKWARCPSQLVPPAWSWFYRKASLRYGRGQTASAGRVELALHMMPSWVSRPGTPFLLWWCTFVSVSPPPPVYTLPVCRQVTWPVHKLYPAPPPRIQHLCLALLSCLCSEIRARYHPNPTPDRWPLESLPLGSETGIQVSAVVGIGDHLGRQLPVSLLVPVSVASVDTTLLPTKFWRRNGVEPEVGALVSILKFGNPQASVIGIGGRLEGSGSLSPSERWFHYS